MGDIMNEVAEHVQQEFSRSWYAIHTAPLFNDGRDALESICPPLNGFTAHTCCPQLAANLAELLIVGFFCRRL